MNAGGVVLSDIIITDDVTVGISAADDNGYKSIKMFEAS